MYGKGLDSIRTRFTLMIGVLVAASLSAIIVVDMLVSLQTLEVWTAIGLAACAVAGSMALTFVVAGRLTDTIEQLRRSTEAIAGGDFEHEVTVDCKCEIGGLADNFRMMVQRLNSNAQRINALAHTDAVTRLPNRLAFGHVLEITAAGAPAGQKVGALMFIDLDDFKQVNDSIGHEAGDDLLREASARILGEGFGVDLETIDFGTNAFGQLRAAPSGDLAFARFAGDEFVALLPGVVERGALCAVAQRIVDSLARPFALGCHSARIGASVGIAILGADSRDPTEIVAYADLAMYAAKQRGGGAYEFYRPAMLAEAQERVRTASELGAGVGAGQIELVYQPIFDARTLRMAGVEALARWRHPARGLLGPNCFIQVAEQSGLIEALGKEVLRVAILQCRAWLDKGVERQISINVSHIQFERPDFASHVLDLAREIGVAGRLIELELTETCAMADPALSLRHLEMLKKEGVRIAIDDFGTGYSNLSHLAQLPFDTLKIDRSMISSLGSSEKSRSIVRAIIQMARAMGHHTVAEGVETRAEFDFLSRNECDLVQGFLLARPMRVEDLDRWHAQLESANRAARVA